MTVFDATVSKLLEKSCANCEIAGKGVKNVVTTLNELCKNYIYIISKRSITSQHV